MIRISNLTLPLVDHGEERLRAAVAKRLDVTLESLGRPRDLQAKCGRPPAP